MPWPARQARTTAPRYATPICPHSAEVDVLAGSGRDQAGAGSTLMCRQPPGRLGAHTRAAVNQAQQTAMWQAEARQAQQSCIAAEARLAQCGARTCAAVGQAQHVVRDDVLALLLLGGGSTHVPLKQLNHLVLHNPKKETQQVRGSPCPTPPQKGTQQVRGTESVACGAYIVRDS